jgi:hypothetical protein
MKRTIIALYDRLVGFNSISLSYSEAVAKRDFIQLVQEVEEIKAKKADIDLFVVGVFDLESGEISAVYPPKKIMNGNEVGEKIEDGV